MKKARFASKRSEDVRSTRHRGCLTSRCQQGVFRGAEEIASSRVARIQAGQDSGAPQLKRAIISECSE